MAKGKYTEWLTEDGLLRVKGWARDGLTDEQIAQNMGISVRTLYDWQTQFPQFSHALKEGKAPVDIEVENALLKSALGFVQTVRKPIKVKVRKTSGDKTIEEEHIEFVDEQVYIPPQTVAQIFWLTNRKNGTWRRNPSPSEDKDSLDRLDAILASIKNNAADTETE